MSACPSRQDLQLFLKEQLSGTMEQEVLAHVDACPACQAALETLTAALPLASNGARTAVPDREQAVTPGANGPNEAFWQRLRTTTPSQAVPLLEKWQRTAAFGEGGNGAGADDFIVETPELPRHVGQYEILRQLGRGGMAVVYLARQVSLNRLVALKVILGGTHAGPDDQQRFRSEAELVARLKHPHIVQIHEIGHHDGLWYLALEYVDGGTLAERLEGNPLPPHEAAALIELLARAIHYAHQHGVIHRDLKPANILLSVVSGPLSVAGESSQRATDHGPRTTPKIADFGLAKQLDKDGYTQTGMAMGTPSYMAPEQAAGRSRAVTSATDVYSLGAVLYELLTGRPPFKGTTPLSTLEQVLKQEPVPPHRLQPHAPRDLETICLKCLEKQPTRRYASAEALAEDLRRYLDGRPILARPTTGWERGWKWARRRPAVAGLLAALAAVTALAFVVIVTLWLDALSARDQARRKQGEAETQRDIAKQNFDEAERQRAGERRQRYRSNIAAALSALQLGHADDCRRALDLAPEEYRRWEWRYLDSQVDLSTGRQTSHHGSVLAVAISPDGRCAASGGDDRQVRIWDVPANRQVAVLGTGDGGFSRVLFSPTGGHLAAVTINKHLHVWETQSWKEVFALPRQCIRPVFTSDGSCLATGTWEGEVQLLDVRTGAAVLKLTIEQGPVETVALHPAGQLLACGGADKTIHLVDIAKAAVVGRLVGHERGIREVRFSPDGKRLLSWSVYPDVDLRLWDVDQRQLVATLPGHTNYCAVATFSPDGRQIASGSLDQTIRLWDGSTGKLQAILRGHLGHVFQLAFTPEGSRLLSSSTQDQAIRLWDTQTGEALLIAHGHSAGVWGMVHSSDGTSIVSGSSDGTVRFWDRRLLEYHGVLRGHTGYAYDVAFSPDRDQVASIAWDGSARVWNLATGAEVKRLPLDTTIGVSLAYSPDGKRLATLARDNAVHVWECATWQRLWTAPVPTDFWIDTRLAWSPLGDLIACGTTGTGAGAVRVLDAETGNPRWVLQGHKGTVCALAFSSDGALLATGGLDKTVRLWDMKTGQTLGECLGHKEQVRAVAFNTKGTVLATGSFDRTVRLWDVAGKVELKVLPHSSLIHSLAFEPQGGRLAVACDDNTIRLWDTATFEEVAELRSHRAYVHAVTFSSDGTRLASASGDFTIRIWDTQTLQQRARTLHAASTKRSR